MRCYAFDYLCRKITFFNVKKSETVFKLSRNFVKKQNKYNTSKGLEKVYSNCSPTLMHLQVLKFAYRIWVSNLLLPIHQLFFVSNSDALHKL